MRWGTIWPGEITAWVDRHIDAADRERFRELAERELIGLHEGNFARYRIRPSDFAAWQAVWTEKAAGPR